MRRAPRRSAPTAAMSTLDLSRLLDTIPAPAILVDEQRRIVGANRRFRETRAGDAPPVGHFCHAVLHASLSACAAEAEACPWRTRPIEFPGRGCVHAHTTAEGSLVEEVWSSTIGRLPDAHGLLLQIFRTLDGTTAPPPGRLAGCSSAIVALRSRLSSLAERTTPALVCGEPGTEREVVARELHEYGTRRGEPFFVLCAACLEADLAHPFALVRRLPSLARAGTVFVDDVARLTEGHQRAIAALMRPRERATALRISARWVLGASVRVGGDVPTASLRPDLAEAVEGATVLVPPVRERPGDLPALVEALRPWLVAPPELQIDPSVVSALAPLPFYGNLWELRCRLQDAVLNVTVGPLRAEHLVWTAWAPAPDTSPDVVSGVGAR